VPRSHLKSRTEMSMAQDRTRTGSPLMTLTQVPQSCSSEFPTWWQCQL
jgi:hypothetical protein